MYRLGYRFCSRCNSWLPSRISWRTSRGEVVKEVSNCPFCGSRVRMNPRRSRSKGRRVIGCVTAYGQVEG
ncbi:MAG TPA: hypothetical protein EYH45_00355 [Candidatus Caldiarchaeum subterraneum]|uniref:Uncharacterized protein n=1 Tax=Caldiarchaeum subterraneum TaxID=311458 RepID=A0A832ZX85_CALS0|nr:hypothetical protein [Aigarchaeota archaeon]HIQ28996.1 hypothetical protein [Candidatus Caldarchaeum subterraneum]